MKVLAVCGMGLGTGLILKMQAEKVFDKLGVDAYVEVADIGSARAMALTAEMVITSSELAEQLGDVKAKVVTIRNFIDLDEMTSKVKAALEEM
ncbi:MAG: PTS ascorbate transporter subunit IIB [Gammaproteobacteria bacterium]|nr:PTS ascorbate transporter subunit IIB [Gammaproteobacteria bacterium]